VGVADGRKHLLWHPPLPEFMTWVRCSGCEHVFTDSFYTDAGLTELFSKAHIEQLAGGDLEKQRLLWTPIIQRVLHALSDSADPFAGGLTWLDVGCGGGGLVFTAEEFGFIATGVDLREEAVRRIRELGYQALYGDLFGVRATTPINVISMADLLEHTPYPVATLKRAHEMLDPKGVLFLSCPNRESSSWREMDRKDSNPYWYEIEHYHNFSRKSLMGLLDECGFVPVNYSVSQRYIACMEIIAVKAGPAEQSPRISDLSQSENNDNGELVGGGVGDVVDDEGVSVMPLADWSVSPSCSLRPVKSDESVESGVSSGAHSISKSKSPFRTRRGGQSCSSPSTTVVK
jgi:protein O-GlcNAc transferase